VQKAMNAAKAGDLASAVRDLKTALLFEKDNENVKKRLAELEEKLKASKPAGSKPGPKPAGR
jgi:hypothetical protein